jgi:hypothetical protein
MIKETQYIDITPTWEQIVPALLLILKSGTADSKQYAAEEITRMAALADKYNTIAKGGN